MIIVKNWYHLKVSFDVVTELYPGGESAIHIHPQQDEIYEVKEGEMQVYLIKFSTTFINCFFEIICGA
jgi:oxalate decarboxylase/phosphoglucose isomerase-like protein (cupin superfamily)